MELALIADGADKTGSPKLEQAKKHREETLEAARAAQRAAQAQQAEKLRRDKERVEAEIDSADPVAEEEAEKKRVEALKKNGLYDQREKDKEAA